jgi:methylenetetrahydrofolate--tRNA-(uracil-5-)-methyltransferase
MTPRVHIIGGGLAGSEAAWQAASLGVDVVVHEMRPVRPTAVHRTDRLAELVCSNSFRGDKLDNAVGLLKEEMRRLGSLVMRAADAARVPAGAALAVDRDRFAAAVTEAIVSHPRITVVREEVPRLPGPERGWSPVIVATGPLTSDALSADLAAFVGRDHLYFYDAISPIVLAETIDFSKVFRASRWGRSLGPRAADDDPLRGLAAWQGRDEDGGGAGPPRARREEDAGEEGAAPEDRAFGDEQAGGLAGLAGYRDARPGVRGMAEAGASARDDGWTAPRGGTCAAEAAEGEGDYLNCPLTKDEYERFLDALLHAESAAVHDFDRAIFFEGCLPIEVMARRGPDTLRFGPMKPVGLVDPRTGRQPYAVVQLRQDNLAGDHYSLVGFQTQLKWGEQARVLRLVPGLERAEFVRYGMVHRNTYINGPMVLRETWQTRARPDLFIAGQVSGVEGYVESAASGLIAGLNAARLALGQDPVAPPRTTAIGALGYYVSHADPRHYDPTNITFGIIQPLERGPRARAARKLAISKRALAELSRWVRETGLVAAEARA